MASVTFPPRLGGSGLTISDDADPGTGLANGGHRERFMPALQGAVDMAQYVYQYAAKIDNAAEDAQRAKDAREYVEAVADQYQINIVEQFLRKCTLVSDFANNRFRLYDGHRINDTTDTSMWDILRSSTATYIDAMRKIRDVSVDVPAYEYDPEGSPLGVLCGSESTNKLAYSEDLTDSSWSFSNAVNLTAKSFDTISGEQHIVGSTSISKAPGSYVCYFIDFDSSQFSMGDTSFTIASPGDIGDRFIIDVSFPDLKITREVSSGGFTDTYSRVVDYGSWFRVILSAKTDLDSVRIRYFSTVASGSGTTVQYRAQMEETPYPASYIPTNGAPETLSSGSISRDFLNDWDSSEGTILLRFRSYPLIPGDSGTLWESENGLDNRIAIYIDPDGSVFTRISKDGVYYNTPSLPFSPGADSVAAISFKEGEETVLAVNGASVKGPPSQLPLTTQEDIHGSGGRTFNGTKSLIARRPRYTSAATLEELTAL